MRKRTLRHPKLVRTRTSIASGLRPCPTCCPLAPAPAAYRSGRAHVAPCPGCCRGGIAHAALVIRRAPGRQQRALGVLAETPTAGALSARLPLASLVSALRAVGGAASRLRRDWRAHCVRAQRGRATAARGGLGPAERPPAPQLCAVSCCPPPAGSATALSREGGIMPTVDSLFQKAKTP